ncbi:MAG: HD domain-containing phosphohydrolase [Rhodanobacteraceae bacterium]
MTASGDLYTRIDHPAEIDELLDVLYEPGGASLVLEQDRGTSLPVVVETASAGDALCLDISAIRDKPQVQALRDGGAFRVTGRNRKGMMRTPTLTAPRVWGDEQRLYCQADFPPWLEKLQRRHTFRARLHRGMTARADLQDGGNTATGWLRDLSLRGCLVELEAAAIAPLDDRQRPLHLELTFPDGSQFMAEAWPRHETIQNDHILCGLHIEVATREQEQQLWRLLRETEREAARNAASARRDLPQSSLFSGAALDGLPDPGANAYHTPMARRLARSAAFLATEVVRLRHGDNLDAALLSQHAERLLALHDEDREGLLFALACLHREPPLIRHCLAVAVRLVDLGAASGLQPTVCKALAAAGMVHDLGKALLPASLRAATQLDAEQVRQVRQHVALIKQRLGTRHWLPPVAIETVVEGANERLDGSGYPNHRGGDKLHELMRLAAIVDVVDATCRDRPDRPGLPIDRILEHLHGSPQQFDPRWLERYIDHFGAWPVGALVRFRDGGLGWVLSLANDRSPSAVRLVTEATSPDLAGGALVCGRDLAQRGEPVEAVSPPPA